MPRHLLFFVLILGDYLSLQESQDTVLCAAILSVPESCSLGAILTGCSQYCKSPSVRRPRPIVILSFFSGRKGRKQWGNERQIWTDG